MSHADWTPSLHTERASRSLRRRVQWGGLHLVGAALSFLGTMGGVMWIADHHLTARPLQIALVLLATVAAGATTFWLGVRDNALRRDAAMPDRTRREEFGAGEGWLVEIIVLQGAAPTGRDRGMLWIEGSRLVFAGDRTAFALSGNDVAGQIRPEEAIGGLRRAFRLPLAHRTAAGPLALSFDVVGRDPEEEILVRDAIDRWTVRALRIDGQRPPTRLGPGALSRADLLLRALAVTALSVGLTLWGIATLTKNLALALVLLVLPALKPWLVWQSVVPHWRAWRDLGRVER